MDARPTDPRPENDNLTPRRGRRLVAVLAVAGALAAVPVGVALAGSSDGSAGGDAGAANSAGAGNVPAQSTTPDESQRGDGDRGDCPEKDGQSGGSEESTQL